MIGVVTDSRMSVIFNVYWEKHITSSSGTKLPGHSCHTACCVPWYHVCPAVEDSFMTSLLSTPWLNILPNIILAGTTAPVTKSYLSGVVSAIEVSAASVC